MRHPAVVPMRQAVANALASAGLPDEFKWSSVSKRTLTRDISAADCFNACYETDGEKSSPRFQSMVVDQHLVDAKGFHGGDRDTCFYKFIYQLLLHRISDMARPSEDVHIVLDTRNTREYDIQELAGALRNGLRKKMPLNTPAVKSVEYRDSKDDTLIQLTDFLTGALGYCWNGHISRAGASEAKISAAGWVCKLAGIDPRKCGEKRSERFGIWPIQIGKRKR